MAVPEKTGKAGVGVMVAVGVCDGDRVRVGLGVFIGIWVGVADGDAVFVAEAVG
jgi:hypothetical protein